MTVTAVKKFNWFDPHLDETKIYFPGQVVDNEDAAVWALDQKYGEERGEQSPARSHVLNAPENKATDLKKAGGANKGKEKNPPKRAKTDEGELVLGSEEEIDQDGE